jgi:hypothetical protein
LLLTVDSQIKADKTRVMAEFAADSANNDDERDVKNKAALEAKNGDLAALLKFETDMKATYGSTDKTLDAATKAHHDATIKYQDKYNELATAIGIEAKNDGSTGRTTATLTRRRRRQTSCGTSSWRWWRIATGARSSTSRHSSRRSTASTRCSRASTCARPK